MQTPTHSKMVGTDIHLENINHKHKHTGNVEKMQSFAFAFESRHTCDGSQVIGQFSKRHSVGGVCIKSKGVK